MSSWRVCSPGTVAEGVQEGSCQGATDAGGMSVFALAGLRRSRASRRIVAMMEMMRARTRKLPRRQLRMALRKVFMGSRSRGGGGVRLRVRRVRRW